MEIPTKRPDLVRLSETLWEIPTSYKKGMRVPARIVATRALLEQMDLGVFEQTTNVATLPGIVKASFCMPDGHWGYGFSIGGVAAFDAKEGIISPGGIGFDINCGMRLITTNLTFKDVKPKLRELVDGFFRTVPAGVGVKGFVQLKPSQFDEVLVDGSQWCAEHGYGSKQDAARTESGGRLPWADPSKVSDKAKKRGLDQLGTLGSGNHYLEIQVAQPPADPVLAERFGITKKDQVVIMVHCGSRGFGHQIGTDYLRTFEDVMRKHKITVPDRELACAPFQDQAGQDYFKAMACAANMAFANRQVILHRIRDGFAKAFHTTAEKLEMNLIYDVAHNTAKLEEHKVDGKLRKLVVHRKGATRAFGPGHPELPKEYQSTGQPVILGGSMETGSWLLVGTQKAMDETWGSTAHGSGRTMSRTQAKHEVNGTQLQKTMEDRGIYVRATSMSGLAEEAGLAYKDINEVVAAVGKAGISKPVVGLRPIGNVKG